MSHETEYYKQLRSTKWRIKRQVILDRDGRKCVACGCKTNLEVHHTFYYSDHIYPWLYPDNSLETLCDKCHYNFHYHHEVPIRPASDRLTVKRSKGKKNTTTKHVKVKKKKKRFLSLTEIQSQRGERFKRRAV